MQILYLALWYIVQDGLGSDSMTDKAISNAMARLEEIQNRMTRIGEDMDTLRTQFQSAAEERERLRAFVATWHEFAGIPFPDEMERIETAPAEPKRVKPKNPDRIWVVDKALEIIRERGEPMSRKELFDALAERGVEIHGKDPEMVLSTMLWRSKDRIQRLPAFGYWPADEAYEPLDQIKSDMDALFN